MDYHAETIATGFAYPEGPRWHGGSLWFSDQHGGKVHVLHPDGVQREEFTVPGRPSGLGWLPDGDLLVVSMQEHRLYRRRGGTLSVYADLAGVHPYDSNEMVVDDAGRAYVGNIGFDFEAGASPAPTRMAIVHPNGQVAVAADDLACPNGIVISPDGRTLIVAESMAYRLTAFDRDKIGRLSNRRVFAELGDQMPDGICLDADGCVWVASCYAGVVLRVREDGEVIDRVPVRDANPYACILGGEDRRTLFICAATHHEPHLTVKARKGRIDAVRVAVAGAGRP